MKKYLFIIILISMSLLSHGQGGIWTWVKGASATGDPGNIGNIRVTNSANYPDGRYEAGRWTDLSGNFWIFGGLDNQHEERNDLWKYNPVSNSWTWINGPLTEDGSGVYGTMGIPSSGNIPGARGWGMRTWTDQQGHLWLFGGLGYDQSGNHHNLADMWMYDIATNQWTWMQGTGISNPVYGTMGIPATANTPGSRYECTSSWVKSDGTFWTFGGSSSAQENDMWKFNISTNEWAWMAGSQGGSTQSYGTINVEASTNVPPGRGSYSNWQDANDNFYIFAGQIQSGLYITTNDVWKFNTSNNRWTWISGDSSFDSKGLFIQQCSPGGGKCPSARFENRTVQKLGCSDQFWTFGGFYEFGESMNDLWNFNPRSGQWTWVSGDSTTLSPGSYGTIGVASPANQPACRMGCCMWIDASGRIWVWGGMNQLSSSSSYSIPKLSDMWVFAPDTTCSPSVASLSAQLSAGNICPGDSASLSVTGGHIISISPSASSAISADSELAYFYPIVTTSYTVIANSLCGLNDTFHYNINISRYVNIAQTYILCPSDSLLFHGHEIHSPGVYTDTINSIIGCDTILTLTVAVAIPLVSSSSATLCQGSSIDFNGRLITSGGTYRDTLISIAGCDSIAVLAVTMLPPVFNSISAGICPRGTIDFNGKAITNTGIYSDTLVKADGCDSIVILTVSRGPADTMEMSLALCGGDTILFHGQRIFSAGIFRDTFSNAAGCDSIISLSVSMLPKPIAMFSIEPMGDSIPLGNIAAANRSVNTDSIFWLLNNSVIALLKDSILPIDSGGNYCIRLVAISQGGCRDSSQQCIYVFGNAFIMPNAFTPNEDGKNDLFYPVFINQNTNAVVGFSIYNRWGQLVYSDPTRGWDGSYKGEAQPGGVYTYYVSVSLPDESHLGQMKVVRKEGSFALMR